MHAFALNIALQGTCAGLRSVTTFRNMCEDVEKGMGSWWRDSHICRAMRASLRTKCERVVSLIFRRMGGDQEEDLKGDADDVKEDEGCRQWPRILKRCGRLRLGQSTKEMFQ